jgi:hypothetical protein
MLREGKMRSGRALVLVGCVLLAITVEAGTVHEVPVVVRFRLADPHSPTFYVRWEGHELRIARSAKELETVKPLRPTRTKVSYYAPDGVYLRDRYYAAMKLAGPVGSFTEVRLRPFVYAMLDDAPVQGRPDPTESDESFAPAFEFRHRDRSGAWWDYRTGTDWPLTRSSHGVEPGLEEVPVPDPRCLALTLSAVPGDRRGARGRVYVEVNAHLGQERLDDLRYNGESVPVRIVVKDARGKTVYSATSALPKLVDARGEEGYSVQVPKGHYTVAVTIGPTPFSKAVTARREVVVEQQPL